MEKKYKITYLPLFYKDLVKITDYMKYTLKNEIMEIRRILYSKRNFNNML